MSELKSITDQMHERFKGGTRPVDVLTPEEKRAVELEARVEKLVVLARQKFRKLWKARAQYKRSDPSLTAHKAIIQAMRKNLTMFDDCTPDEKADISNRYAALANEAMKEEVENLDFVRAEEPEALETVQ